MLTFRSRLVQRYKRVNDGGGSKGRECSSWTRGFLILCRYYVYVKFFGADSMGEHMYIAVHIWTHLISVIAVVAAAVVAIMFYSLLDSR